MLKGRDDRGGDFMRMQHTQLKRGRYRTGRRRWLPSVLVLIVAAAAGAWYGFFRPVIPSAWLSVIPKEAEAQVTKAYTLPAGTWYALQLGAFEAETSACALADSFIGRGAGGCIREKDGLFTVLAAAYPSREEALRVQENLRTWHQVDTTVACITWPEITLQLSGTKSQADALLSGYDCLFSMAGEWGQLAVALDSGEVKRTDAEGVLTSHRETASALQDALVAAFGSQQERHPMVEQVITMLQQSRDTLAQAMEESGAARFGAQVKKTHLQLITGLEGHMEEMSLLLNTP